MGDPGGGLLQHQQGQGDITAGDDDGGYPDGGDQEKGQGNDAVDLPPGFFPKAFARQDDLDFADGVALEAYRRGFDQELRFDPGW